MELVDIKDISGNIRFSTPINEGSKRHFLLMQEDYVTLKFSLASPIYFKLGDYIDNELGIFEVVDLYKPTYNTTSGGYDSALTLITGNGRIRNFSTHLKQPAVRLGGISQPL